MKNRLTGNTKSCTAKAGRRFLALRLHVYAKLLTEAFLTVDGSAVTSPKFPIDGEEG